MRKSCFIPFLLVAILFLAIPAASPAQVSVGISVHVGPPALPVYAQPICPGPGYVWTPGYWAYGGDGYYWVPGTWVVAPVGMLWTPGYWGWGEGAYLWHAGYWGPHVGFYGGINYGFGYGGVGFGGGRWNGRVFVYNTAVTHVDTTVVHTTYVDRTVIVNNTTVNRVSFNGGHGGIEARPNPQEANFDRERHVPPVSAQVHHAEAARSEPALHSNANHGVPGIAATAHAASFTGPGVVHARGAATAEPHAGGPAGAPPAHTGGPAGAGPVHPTAPEPPAHAVQHTAPPTHAIEPPHATPPAPVAQPQAHEIRPQTPPHVEQHAPAPPHVEQHAPPPHEPAAHEPPPRGNEHEHEQH